MMYDTSLEPEPQKADYENEQEYCRAYERWEDDYYNGDVYFNDSSDVSCGFCQASGDFTRLDETSTWNLLCNILSRQKELDRAMIVATTGKELLTDLLASCPYATCVGEEKSKHGDYSAYVWMVKQ